MVIALADISIGTVSREGKRRMSPLNLKLARLPRGLLMCALSIALFLSTALAAVSASGEDWTEFGDVAAARQLGWCSKGGAALELVTDAVVGETALRVQGGPEAKAYTGMTLKHEVDLTNAGPGDSIVFHVKQNYKAGVYLNIQTPAGHIYRSIALKNSEWTRVEFGLDRNNWQGKASNWGVASAFSFYHRNFDQPDEYMILDGLTMVIGGTLITPKTIGAPGPLRWDFPDETDAAWYLGGADAAWAVSKASGQLAGGWHVRHRERCLMFGRHRYHVESVQDLVTGIEDDDRVLRTSFDAAGQVLTVWCSNAAVPALAIRKEYRVDGARLLKTVGLEWAGAARTFITLNSETALTPGYRRGGYYMGAGFVGPIVPAPELTGWQPVTVYKTTTKGMLLHQPSRDYAFAHVRSRLDGRFAWPWFSGAISGYVEAKNKLHYTPYGWDLSLGTSPLPAGRETTFEEYCRVVPGNWFTWLAETYPRQDEVQAELAQIPPVPDWVSDVKACLGFGRDGMTRLRRIVESTRDGTIMVLLSGWGSWADYDVEGGLEGGDGGRITGPELRDLVRRIKAVSPRVKVGIYQWVVSTTDNTRIFRKHPEWFRLRDKQGNPKTTFPGHAMNYAAMLSIPECHDELLGQFDHVLSYLGTDFIYLDDPKALNMVNWETGDFTRDDLCYRFLLDLRRTVAKHGSDKMLFFNCRGNPYGDINFVEARGQLRDGFWRDFVGLGACMEAFLAARPKARIVPLYWITPLAREYVNRVLALGWIPSLTYGEDVGRLPFARAAYEMGNSHQVDADYAPDWKTDPATEIESYLTQREGDTGWVLSLISHEGETRDVPVSLSTEKMGVGVGSTLWVWDHRIEDATTFSGTVTEPMAARDYGRGGWHTDRVVQRALLHAGPVDGGALRLNVTLEPLILHQLYISAQPAAVYAEDGLPCNYLFGKGRRVALKTVSVGPDQVALEVISDAESADVLLLRRDVSMLTAELDGVPVDPLWVYEDDVVLPLVRVSKGRHVMRVTYSSGAQDSVPLGPLGVSVEEGEMVVELHGCTAALFTLHRDGRMLLCRQVSNDNGGFRLSLGEGYDSGEYTLVCRAILEGKQVRRVSGSAGTVVLPGHVPELGITPAALPRIPETFDVQPVNQTVAGVRVLSSARFTTSTPLPGWQPELPALVASVDVSKLTVHAGTTRKISAFRGAAFAGLEIADLRKVRLKLTNSYCTATHMRGKGKHSPQYRSSKSVFGGMVVDYHTEAGYAHRVGFAVGLLHPQCNCRRPTYGKDGPMDTIIDLGPIVDEGPEKVFALDLERYAPPGWDGRVWFSVGSDFAAPDRRLTATILAVNDAVSDGFLEGTDPRDLAAEYGKAKVIEIPRAPVMPNLDGAPDDEIWQHAAVIEKFFLLGGGGLPKSATRALLFYDEQNLYIGIICRDPDRAAPIINNGAVWHDDEVEFMFDTNGDKTTYFQILVNGVGQTYTLRTKDRTDLTLTAKAHQQRGQWMLEIAIPFRSLEVGTPKTGASWGFNVVRNRMAGAEVGPELITWAPLEHGFVEPENLGKLVFR